MTEASQGGIALGSLGSQEKRGLEGRFKGLAWDKLLLPIAPLVASLLGLLEFRRKTSGIQGRAVL